MLQSLTLVFGKYFANHIIVLLVFRFCKEAWLSAHSRVGRRGNRNRNRDFALREMNEIPELHFKRMFRMSKYAFQQLLTKLGDYYDGPTDEIAASNSSGELIEANIHNKH